MKNAQHNSQTPSVKEAQGQASSFSLCAPYTGYKRCIEQPQLPCSPRVAKVNAVKALRHQSYRRRPCLFPVLQRRFSKKTANCWVQWDVSPSTLHEIQKCWHKPIISGSWFACSILLQKLEHEKYSISFHVKAVCDKEWLFGACKTFCDLALPVKWYRVELMEGYRSPHRISWALVAVICQGPHHRQVLHGHGIVYPHVPSFVLIKSLATLAQNGMVIHVSLHDLLPSLPLLSDHKRVLQSEDACHPRKRIIKQDQQ